MSGSSQPVTSDYSSLQFQYPFRKYQQMILDLVERQSPADHKVHLVAPPGAGKTIVGLELIRRFGRSALVFAPTSTIQRQWLEKLQLFAPDREWVRANASLDPAGLAPINIFTYQLLSTPGENLAFVQGIAVERWVQDLLDSDQAQDEDGARGRIATMETSNPKAYRREVAKRYRRVKREILQQGDFDGRRFLHRNARDLIDRIVALGVGTIVLDECHHLLDYWAFILRELIQTLPGVRVVGLTATLPNPANESEYQNYSSLLGEVDFEIPTPAVIKEGNLAPFRDLVYFCQPSPREGEYLMEIQDHFEAAVERVTETPAFWGWVQHLIIMRHGNEPFADFYDRQPQLCIAGVKYLLGRDYPFPADLPIIEEMLEPVTVDEWLVLLETFGLQVLKVSADPEDQALFRELRQALLPFGISITERGIRHQRSPGDLVLALSESKDEAVTEILRAELGALGPRLRAVVITDFERLSARARRLKGILDPDAGSALRLFHHLVADPETNTLDPVLVTGNVVLVDADQRGAIDAGIRSWAQERHARFEWEWRPTGSPWELELVGRGPEWSSRTYVALITSLFEQGITRCLVGTRGIFGEGWDSLRLNTLVDLTAVTTSTGVRQIRGRGLRLDPAWPRKVAHNWDVVCYSSEFKKGDADLRRFVARHAHTWGLVTRSRAQERSAGALGETPPELSLHGRILRGAAHVDPDLARDLALSALQDTRLADITRRAMAAVDQRDHFYDLWDVGGPYANHSYTITQLASPQQIRYRTSFTVQRSLTALSWQLVPSGLALALPAGLVSLAGMGLLPTSAAWAASLAVSGAGALAISGVNGLRAWRLFSRSFLDLPADAVLSDMGKALLAALRDAGLVRGDLNEDDLRVEPTTEGGYEISLPGAAPEDADRFSRAFQELMGPIGNARYLIERDGASLRNIVYRPLWFLLRKSLMLEEDIRAYHRVPDILASRRERAELLAHHWKHWSVAVVCSTPARPKDAGRCSRSGLSRGEGARASPWPLRFGDECRFTASRCLSRNSLTACCPRAILT